MTSGREKVIEASEDIKPGRDFSHAHRNISLPAKERMVPSVYLWKMKY